MASLLASVAFMPPDSVTRRCRWWTERPRCDDITAVSDFVLPELPTIVSVLSISVAAKMLPRPRARLRREGRF
jgi:hypothetical protein